MTAQTEADDTDEPITTTVYGAWSESREKVVDELKSVLDGTTDEIDLQSGGTVWVEYVDTDDIWITLSGGVDANELPAGCTLEGVRINNDRVAIELNHRALD